MSITSTRGKLELLQKYYQHLGNMNVDSVFDADWKEEVQDRVNGYSSLYKEAGVLDKEIEKREIAKCVRKL